MLYTTITIKDKEYKLRLNAKACVEAEKKLGTNPLNIFMECDSELPSLEALLTLFHCSLQSYQHGISLEDVYNLYDDYCEDGGDLVKFTEVIVELFKASGFIPKDEIKNA